MCTPTLFIHMYIHYECVCLFVCVCVCVHEHCMPNKDRVQSRVDEKRYRWSYFFLVFFFTMHVYVYFFSNPPCLIHTYTHTSFSWFSQPSRPHDILHPFILSSSLFINRKKNLYSKKNYFLIKKHFFFFYLCLERKKFEAL